MYEKHEKWAQRFYIEIAQTINYLRATGIQLGLLINFSHHPKIEYERFINPR